MGIFFFFKARKNREIAHLQRKIDEVPSRAELTQYQRRFIELYGQGNTDYMYIYMYLRSFMYITVSSMLNETRQYYTLYNSLEDQREYMEKEVHLYSDP